VEIIEYRSGRNVYSLTLSDGQLASFLHADNPTGFGRHRAR